MLMLVTVVQGALHAVVLPVLHRARKFVKDKVRWTNIFATFRDFVPSKSRRKSELTARRLARSSTNRAILQAAWRSWEAQFFATTHPPAIRRPQVRPPLEPSYAQPNRVFDDEFDDGFDDDYDDYEQEQARTWF